MFLFQNLSETRRQVNHITNTEINLSKQTIHNELLYIYNIELK